MSTITITKAENVRRYTQYTVDSDALTPDQLAYIGSGDDPIEGDGDKVFDKVLKDETKETAVTFGDADDLAVTYCVDGITELNDTADLTIGSADFTNDFTRAIAVLIEDREDDDAETVLAMLHEIENEPGIWDMIGKFVNSVESMVRANIT
ncbi:MAG: hypothetical protein ACTMIV_10920 [Brevibacterium aurantiacum]